MDTTTQAGPAGLGRRVVRVERGFSNVYRTPYAYGILDCGHSTKATEGAVDCERCGHQARNLDTLRAALAEGRVTHSRCRGGIYGDSIHVYQRDDTSPTGVMLLVSVDPTPEALTLLRGGLSPLSPTEAR